MPTVPAGASAYGTLSATRKSRIRKHQVDATVAATATVASENATVAVATDAADVVRQADRKPSPETAKRTGRIRRVEHGCPTSRTLTAGGSGYTNQTAAVQNLVGGTGTGAKATITVAGGVVTNAFLLVSSGRGYQVGDVLTCNEIGAGTGFEYTVDTIGQA